ncbi:hypothetical protein Vretifemale_11834, partial [Volvox reticuliferus]
MAEREAAAAAAAAAATAAAAVTTAPNGAGVAGVAITDPANLASATHGSGRMDRPCSAPEWRHTRFLEGGDTKDNETDGWAAAPVHMSAAMATSAAVGEGLEGVPTIRALPPDLNNCSGAGRGCSSNGTGCGAASAATA